MDFDEKKVQYPCPDNKQLTYPKMTSIQECEKCYKHLSCDVYATMLDEVHDMK